MPWEVNVGLIAWFLLMAYVSQADGNARMFFISCAIGWAVGYLMYLGIR